MPSGPFGPALSTFLDAEIQLLELAQRLEDPVPAEPYPVTLITLGQRSTTLFQAFLELQGGAARLAARSLLRPMVEINMLIRFLSKDPELHTFLWEAEGERSAITLADEIVKSPSLSERWGVQGLNEDELVSRRAMVVEAREKARAAGVVGIGKTGAVLPSISQQLITINEAEANEAYSMVYRALSWDVHGGARTFMAGTFERYNDGTVSYSEMLSADSSIAARALAVAMFASTLKMLGTELGLPIVEQADDVQRMFVPDQGE